MISIVAVVGAVVLITPSAAVGACIPGRHHQDGYWYAGWERLADDIPGNSVGDVYARIYQYDPYVYPNAINSTLSFVMIWNDAFPIHYVQIGWLKSWSGSRLTFDEWTDKFGNSTRSVGPPSAVGSFTPYEVYWNPITQRLETYQNGVLWGSHIRYFTMRSAQNYAEIQSLASQMPGGTNDHEKFDEARVANLSGAVYPFDGDIGNSIPNSFGAVRASSSELHVWDRACTL